MNRHVWSISLDDGWLQLHVTCPYGWDDTDRPCWPHLEDGTPEPTPQSYCTYQSWVENCTPEELLHGQIELPLPAAEIDWSNGDYPVVHVAGRVR